MHKRTSFTAGETTRINALNTRKESHTRTESSNLRLRLASQTDDRPAILPVPGWHVRSRSSQALVEAELGSHCQQLWDFAPCGFLIVDTFGAVLQLNETARQLLAPRGSSTAPVSLSACIDAEDLGQLTQYLNDVFTGKPTAAIELRVNHGDSADSRFIRITTVATASLTAALAFTDVTDAKRLGAERNETEERLQQLQRLELVHAMSAGIVHDFKNIVHVIESYATILMGQPGDRPHETAVASQIMKAASRGTMLANRWLMFSRNGQLEKQVVDASEFVVNCMESIAQVLPTSIHVETRPSVDPVSCELDPCLVEQVLLNLCTNARDAMPEGGKLTVRVERVAYDSQASSHDLLPAGVYAKVTVEDTGIGIPAEYLDRIFEPFFTTKESHAGTGLGLSLVRSIISEHQGAIEVWSEVGNGSAIAIYLPQ